ncbi:MAG: bifunctional ADP-heptose synthase [Saprospiraceae bacterium]
MTEQQKKIHDFSKTQVLVIGDIMIDQYWFGDVNRVSPEAPVPVVDLQKIENRLGGAGNVAINLKAMGANVDVIGITGHDENGKEMIRLLEKESIGNQFIIPSSDRRTTVKSRVMAHGQNLLRIDQEDCMPLSKLEWTNFISTFSNYTSQHKPDIIILQDYNKGLLIPDSIQFVINYANQHGIPTIVDPKKDHFFQYKGCTLFKPNKKEVLEAFGEKVDVNLRIINEQLLNKLQNKYNFITLGAEGIFVGSKIEQNIYETQRMNVIDVCGAGDTVIAILALYWTKSLPSSTLARLANIAGGQVCGVVGVAPIQKTSFLEEVFNQQII